MTPPSFPGAKRKFTRFFSCSSAHRPGAYQPRMILLNGCIVLIAVAPILLAQSGKTAKPTVTVKTPSAQISIAVGSLPPAPVVAAQPGQAGTPPQNQAAPVPAVSPAAPPAAATAHLTAQDFTDFDTAVTNSDTVLKAIEKAVTAKAALDKDVDKNSFDAAALTRFAAWQTALKDVTAEIDIPPVDSKGQVTKGTLLDLLKRYEASYDQLKAQVTRLHQKIIDSPDSKPDKDGKYPGETDIPGFADKLQKVKDAFTPLDVRFKVSSSKDAREALVKSVGAVAKNLNTFVKAAQDTFAKLTAHQQTVTGGVPPVTYGDPRTLVNELPDELPALVTVAQLRRQIPKAQGLATELSKVKYEGKASDEAAVGAPPATDPQKTFDKGFDDLQPYFAPWMETLATYTYIEDGKAFKVFESAADAGEEQGVSLNRQVKATLATHAETDTKLKKIGDALASFWSEAQRSDFPNKQFIALRNSNFADDLQALQTAATRFTTTLNLLRAPIIADMSKWEADQITLYYFDDIPQLMHVLNEDVQEIRAEDAAKARQASQTAKTELVKATFALVDARAKVNDARRELANAQEALRQSRFKLQDSKTEQAAAQKDAQAEIDRLTAQQRVLANHKTLLDNRLDFLNKRLKVLADKEAAETDPVKKAKITDEKDKLQLQIDELSLDAANAETARALQEKQLDEANEGLGKITNDEVTAAQGAVDKAQTALDAAQGAEQTAVSEAANQANTAYMAALIDNREFANARDNAPYWASIPDFARRQAVAPAGSTPATATATGTPAPTPTTAPTASEANGDLSDALKSDPLHRVMLFGFPDSKTIFIRGSKADVRRVKAMISDFDQPQTQTLLTLYTFEFSSKSTQKGDLRMAKAVDIVQREIDITKTQTERTVALTRDVVLDQVKQSVDDFRQRSIEMGLGGYYDFSDAELAPFAFYDSEVLRQFGWQAGPLADLPNTASPPPAPLPPGAPPPYDAMRNPSPLTHQYAAVLGSMLPNPNNISTLGEVIFVMSLAKNRYRNKATSDFVHRAPAILDTKIEDNDWQAVTAPPNLSASQKIRVTEAERARVYVRFPHLLNVFGGMSPNLPYSTAQLRALFERPDLDPARTRSRQMIDEQESPTPTRYDRDWLEGSVGVMTVLRNEVVDALLAYQLPKLLAYSQFVVRRQDRLTGEIARLQKELDAIPIPFPFKKQARAKVLQDAISQRSEELIEGNSNYNYQSFLSLWPVLRKYFPTTSLEQMQDTLRHSTVQQMLDAMFRDDAEGQARMRNARLAAANELLKEVQSSITDDLHAAYVQPMMERLRTRIHNEASINLGVIQQTSILGRNRLISRVDPSASAQLEAGTEQNPLRDVSQLVTFLTSLQSGTLDDLGKGGAKKPLSPANAAALLGTTATGAGVPAMGALATLKLASNAAGQLDRLPYDAPPGVYGITSGNTFQVTPVADPTGQALRFRFDQLLSTQVREPNGSVVPQLNRIERHSINTEVQLSNHEIRLVSRFDSTAKIGIPSRKKGGIPILRDIPVIKELPLVGWFSKFGGGAATVQQSLVLAQADMFPALNDMIDLLPRATYTLPNELSLPGADKDWDDIPSTATATAPTPLPTRPWPENYEDPRNEPKANRMLPSKSPNAPVGGAGAGAEAQAQAEAGASIGLPDGPWMKEAGVEKAKPKLEAGAEKWPVGRAYVQMWNTASKRGILVTATGYERYRKFIFTINDVTDSKLSAYLGASESYMAPTLPDLSKLPSNTLWVNYLATSNMLPLDDKEPEPKTRMYEATTITPGTPPELN